MSQFCYINGAELVMDRRGALYWPDRKMLVVADLHFGKGAAFAAAGQLLPPYDTAATLTLLESLIAAYRPRQVVALGDSFHDEESAARLDEESDARLRAMVEAVDWTWILGNHDPAIEAGLGGAVTEELVVGPLLFRHEASLGRVQAGEISGHFHPKACVRVRQKRLTQRCFVGDPMRLVLPAFGAFTGGLDVLDQAISRLFADDFRVWLLGRQGVYPFPSRALQPIAPYYAL